MAGIRGRSGPPGNQNLFRHGLAGIAQRRADGVLNPQNNQSEKRSSPVYWPIRGGAEQISSAIHVLAEIIASDVSLLVTLNRAIDGVIHNNPTARRIQKRWRNWTATTGR
jgi:hypothetical protein